MKFCSQCGGPLVQRIPPGDNSTRHLCDRCGQVHYQNPRVVAGTLPVHRGRVLLCRRAIEPRYGRWTLPAGFLENGETIQDGARRETWEEALAQVQLQGLYTLFNLPQIAQMHLFFRAELNSDQFGAGLESLEVELFSEHEIPWDNLAFPVIERTLRHYFEDRQTGHYPLRIEDLNWREDRQLQVTPAQVVTPLQHIP